ncbi:MAG TPA: protease pro-enzyme activation domain-containing protein, partial [Candidatus Acidoferrales bacterium]|nr:protease pro-enzyme activation domain-containing protein [Candidatus Acidoferrales bacterium]
PAAAAIAPHAMTYRGPRALASFSWGEDLVRRARFAGPAESPWGNVHVLVTMHDPAGLRRFAMEASTPGSAEYRRFLTPSQIADRFGATKADYKKAAHYFVQAGLRVGEWPQRELLTVSGPTKKLEAAFGTRFGTFSIDGVPFVAPVDTPHFTKAIPVAAADLAHVPSRTFIITNGDVLGYSPQQMGRAFDYSGAWSQGFTGRGITIGVIGSEGISLADMPYLARIYGVPHARLRIAAAKPQPANEQNGNTGSAASDPYPAGLAPPPPITAPCRQTYWPDYQVCNPEDGGEAQLDSQMTSLLAPGSDVNFYLAYNPSECYDSHTESFYAPVSVDPIQCATGMHLYQQLGSSLLWDDELQQAIADDTADAISESIGVGEWQEPSYYLNKQGTGVGQIEYASLAAEGIAVFDASGDTGQWECWGYGSFDPNRKCQNYPASDANVTAVGGLNVPLDSAGNLTAPMTGWGYQTEAGGNGTFDNNTGSGGGFSDFNAAPPWQIGVKPWQRGAVAGWRALPDISMQADPSTGPTIALNTAFGGAVSIGPAGGTSAAAPEMTAMWALVLQACKRTPSCATAGGAHPYRLGNAAPVIYAIFKNAKSAGFTPQLPARSVFFDVVQGNTDALNALQTKLMKGFNAGRGYDLVTGVGAPYAGHLIQAITGRVVP